MTAPKRWSATMARWCRWAPGGVYTSWFQFSKTRGDILPTHFGQRYQDDLKRAAKITPLFHANVTGIRLRRTAAGRSSGHRHPDGTRAAGQALHGEAALLVLACGGMENARLLLASNDVMNAGVGNQNDLVGRFFADNPIPRDTATMVLFAGPSPISITTSSLCRTARSCVRRFRAHRRFARRQGVTGSLTTVENPVKLDALGIAAVVATAQALGVDASNAKAYSLGCGMELAPDPDRRLTLSEQRDALGMPRLKLNMTIADDDFARYRRTLAELGRQLLAARTGMIKLNYSRREQWLAAMDWGNHHLGTTRMSDDPKSGVVDAEGKVHGVGNLYVAGSSVFPTYGASNPTLNLLALTLRLGDHLKKVMA